MSGRFGDWLAGGGAPADPATPRDGDARHPGSRFGLPARGPGAVVSLGRRLFGLIADCVLAALVTPLLLRIFGAHAMSAQAQNYWAVLVWFVITVVGVGLFGFTPGMALLGFRIARVDGAPMVGPLRAIVRSALVFTIVPAAICDADQRGLHDRAVGTIAVALR